MLIGASVYFSCLDFEYIESIIATGVESIFTTVVMPEEEYNEEFYRNLENLKNITKKNNVGLITDISERLFEKLNIQSIFELKEMGFSGLRLDSGFQDVETVKNLTEKFQVYLNGSHITESQLDLYKEKGVPMDKITIMHNFYPKRFSGLDDDLFNTINQTCLKYDVRIIAFVPGNTVLRGPEHIGLPTLESHRGVSPYVAYLDLIHSNQIDDVFIGDPGISIVDLQMIIEHAKTGVISIPSHFTNDLDLFDKIFSLRDDYSNELYRISIKDLKVVTASDSKILNRKKGMITLDNIFSGRYNGELNLCRRNLAVDKQVSIIGQIDLEYIDILDYLNRGAKIKFVS